MIACDPPQVVACDVAQAKRLGHRQRAILEVRRRRQQLDVDALLGEAAQCDERLQRCHATPGDQDFEWLCGHASQG